MKPNPLHKSVNIYWQCTEIYKNRTLAWTCSAWSVLAVTPILDFKLCLRWEAIAETSRGSMGQIKWMGNPITVVVVTSGFDPVAVQLQVHGGNLIAYVCVVLMLCVFLNVVLQTHYILILIESNGFLSFVSSSKFHFHPMCDTEIKRQTVKPLKCCSILLQLLSLPFHSALFNSHENVIKLFFFCKKKIN